MKAAKRGCIVLMKSAWPGVAMPAHGAAQQHGAGIVIDAIAVIRSGMPKTAC
jgi:hypothetical protein